MTVSHKEIETFRVTFALFGAPFFWELCGFSVVEKFVHWRRELRHATLCMPFFAVYTMPYPTSPAFDTGSWPGHARAEYGQARVRWIIAALFVLYGLTVIGVAHVARNAGLLSLASLDQIVASGARLSWLFTVQTVLAISLWFWVRERPTQLRLRRVLAMANDYGFLCVALVFCGKVALPAFAAVLWVTVGYGLRYGVRALVLGAGLAYAAIAAAVAANPYLRSEPFIVLTVLLSVTVVPAYLVQLLSRLTRTTAQLVEANRAKSRFIATMNHELRNPLNSIVGMSALLRATRQTDEQTEYANVIQASAQALTAIVQDVLDLAAVEAGKIAIKAEPFHLHRLLDALRVIHEPAARAKGLILVLDVETSLAPCYVGDGGRVSQILGNLIGNAIKFTDEGRILVRCRADWGRDGHAGFSVDVEDTGIGIAPEHQARIFEPFEQAAPVTTRAQGGTGLGIPIARSLARAMGGDVELQARRGGGSVFRVCLPLPVGSVVADVQAPANVVNMHDLFGRHRRDVRPLRILAVEDIAANRLLLERLLQRAGHQVIVASDAGAGLDLLAESDVDLVLADLHMPGMDGTDFIKHLRVQEAGRARRTPVVVISGDSTTESVRDALAAGADDFLSKPLHPDRLLAAVAAFSPKPLRDVAAVTPMPMNALAQLRDGGLSEAFLARYQRMVIEDMRALVHDLQRALFTQDAPAAAALARDLQELAIAIDAPSLAEQAQQLVDAREPRLPVAFGERVARIDEAITALAVDRLRSVHGAPVQELIERLGAAARIAEVSGKTPGGIGP